MTIEPDTKDWTWVLQERCPECGLVAADVDPRTLGDLVRGALPRWRAVLARPDASRRPDPTTWSPAEYGCHVRDVLTVFEGRVALMLAEDDPEFENWDQDATAESSRYAEQDPAVAADELAAAGERTAAAFDAVPDDAWERTGRRSNGSRFTVRTLGQYFWHDVAHHLVDVDG
ncbi:MAG: DinB family protein [Aeromicrobium erythreum]